MKILKKVLIGLGILLAVLLVVIIIALLLNNSKTKKILNDYSKIYKDSKYSEAILIDNVSYIKQDISCGYAVIEMFAKWSGNDKITEKVVDFAENLNSKTELWNKVGKFVNIRNNIRRVIGIVVCVLVIMIGIGINMGDRSFSKNAQTGESFFMYI